MRDEDMTFPAFVGGLDEHMLGVARDCLAFAGYVRNLRLRLDTEEIENLMTFPRSENRTLSIS